MAEIVEGPGKGRTSSQEPCDKWSYGNGFEINDLPLAKLVTLQFRAEGFITRERRVNVTVGGLGILVELERE